MCTLLNTRGLARGSHVSGALRGSLSLTPVSVCGCCLHCDRRPKSGHAGAIAPGAVSTRPSVNVHFGHHALGFSRETTGEFARTTLMQVLSTAENLAVVLNTANALRSTHVQVVH